MSPSWNSSSRRNCQPLVGFGCHVDLRIDIFARRRKHTKVCVEGNRSLTCGLLTSSAERIRCCRSCHAGVRRAMGRQEHPGMAGGNPQGALGFPFSLAGFASCILTAQYFGSGDFVRSRLEASVPHPPCVQDKLFCMPTNKLFNKDVLKTHHEPSTQRVPDSDGRIFDGRSMSVYVTALQGWKEL